MAINVTKIILMTWTKKHEEFCLKQKLRPSTLILLRWILRRSNSVKVDEIEVDLRIFNAWVAKKRGRGFDRKTLREAIAQLDEKTQGLILITKKYSAWIFKLMVRPLNLVLAQSSRNAGKSPKPPTGNPMFSGDRKKASREQLLQNISKLDSLFKKLGMNYTPDSLMRIWRFAGKKMSEVENAVEYMLRCHNEKLERSSSIQGEPEGIPSPKGWLHDCLKYGWHINKDESIQLPRFDSIKAISNFIRDISPKLSCRNQLRYQA